MRALIIAGGLGTRLRPVTDHVPKSLLPICNVPFLEHQIRLLARHGIDEATLLTGYRAKDFDRMVPQAARHGVALSISTEERPLGTAGAVRNALQDDGGSLLVLNGDVLTDFDLHPMIEQHRATGAIVTMALTEVDDSGGYGVVKMDEAGRVAVFVQNPKGESRPADWINAGIYVMEPRALDRVRPGERAEFEHPPDPVFPALLADGEPFYGYRAGGYWIDIGTRERYLQVHRDILDGRIDAAMDGTLMRDDKDLPDGTRIVGPTLLAHAPVGSGTTLGPHAVLGAGCRIGERAVVERSIVHGGATVGARAVIRDSILGATAIVDEGAEVVGAILA